MTGNAQKVFTLNGETCVELYTVYENYDQISNPEYGKTSTDANSVECRTYLVAENLTANDTIILKKWKSLSDEQQTKCVMIWYNQGKRVEIERSPFSGVYTRKQPFIRMK